MSHLGIRGISLVQVMVGLAITTLLVVFMFIGTTLVQKISVRQTASAQQESQVNSLYVHLLKVGRGSASCASPQVGVLQCQLDRGRPPSGPLIETRFSFQASTSEVLVEEFNAGQWVPQTTYSGISQFDLCADDVMISGTCPIPPQAINAAHTQNLSTATSVPTPANRFFRFRIVAFETKEKVRFNTSLQGAFWVRNSPLDPSIVYLWGLK